MVTGEGGVLRSGEGGELQTAAGHQMPLAARLAPPTDHGAPDHLGGKVPRPAERREVEGAGGSGPEHIQVLDLDPRAAQVEETHLPEPVYPCRRTLGQRHARRNSPLALFHRAPPCGFRAGSLPRQRLAGYAPSLFPHPPWHGSLRLGPRREELSDAFPQNLGQSFQRRDPRITLPSLQAADMHIVQARAFRQPPLTQPSDLSPGSNRFAYRLSGHDNISVTRQTASVKCVLRGMRRMALSERRRPSPHGDAPGRSPFRLTDGRRNAAVAPSHIFTIRTHRLVATTALDDFFLY